MIFPTDPKVTRRKNKDKEAAPTCRGSIRKKPSRLTTHGEKCLQGGILFATQVEKNPTTNDKQVKTAINKEQVKDVDGKYHQKQQQKHKLCSRQENSLRLTVPP